MGDGAGRPHPGRSRRPRQHASRRSTEIKQRLENGELHALVNNAAISPKADAGKRLGSIDTTLDVWQHVFHVNFFAPIMLARGLLDELKAAQGAVVNVTSIAGSRVHPFAGAAYSTSKAALAALTREMAADFGPLGIRVNAIAPGEIDTAILSPGTEEIVAHQIPMHRLGTPDEVAKIIYVLCTETVVLRERRRDPHQRRPARLGAAHRSARRSEPLLPFEEEVSGADRGADHQTSAMRIARIPSPARACA